MTDADPADPFRPPPHTGTGPKRSSLPTIALVGAACVAAVIGLVVVALVLGVLASQMKIGNK